MAHRSKSFRFRIPWLSVPSESFVRRTKDRPKSPPHSDTSVPIQRPSKPSVVAPSELSPPSPTKSEDAIETEPQKQYSPPHPTQPPSSSLSIGSPVKVQTQPKTPSSPQPPLQLSSHADSSSHVHVASSPPKTQHESPHLTSDNGAMKVQNETTPQASSSSEQEKEKMVLSEEKPQEAEEKVKSPSNLPDTSFKPERMSPQPADTEQQVSSVPSSSPISKAEPNAHPSSRLASKEINTEETTRQEEKEKAVVVPQEEKPKIKSPLKTTPKSPETSSQPENPTTQSTAIASDQQRSATPKAPLETQSKSLHSEEKEKAVHETTKAKGKGKDTTTATASSSGTATTKIKDSFTKVIHGEKKPHGARENVERKLMFSTTSPIGKDTRVMNSTQEGTKNVASSSIAPETTVSFSDDKAPPLQKGIKDDITKFVHKLTASVHPTQPMDEKQFSVITLAGDNRGATMHLGSESAKKEGTIHIHRAYKSDHEETNEVSTDGEENNNQEEEEEVGLAYVNSNIQSINNSLMFHGSITERDPGVQVTLPQKLTEPSDKPKPGLETQKTQFNVNRARKSMYQPTVGRSIRGPFLEPNDKPHHQGCKFSSDQDIEDIAIL